MSADPSRPVDHTPQNISAAEDLFCPICAYNLRGVSDPRCPECGLTFTWEDMRDPRRRLHAYLFEHHPERNVWSFVRTLLGGLWPPRFWSRLNPLQRVDVPRLILYWKLNAAILLVCLLVFVTMMVVQYNHANENARNDVISQMARMPWYRTQMNDFYKRNFNGSQDKYFETYFPIGIGSALYRQRGELFWTLALTFQVLAWPWLSYLSLVSFRHSMKRVNKGRIHVLRCCIYSLDFLTFIAALVALANALWRILLIFDNGKILGFVRSWVPSPLPSEEMAPILDGMMIALFAGWRLYVAGKRYMQFNNPLATVVASQMLAFLLILNVLILYVWIN